MLNNKFINKYTVYNSDNTIKEQYVRKPSPLDGMEPVEPETVYTVAPSQISNQQAEMRKVYYGEWVKTPQEEIDKLNDIILSKKPQCNTSARPLTDREIREKRTRDELEKALALLNEKLEQKEVR